MQTLFDQGEDTPTGVVALHLTSWREPSRFAEILQSLAVLHNRILVLKKYRDAVTKNQLLHPATALPPEDMLEVRQFPQDGRPLEFYAYPAIARTLCSLLGEVAAAAPREVPFPSLIVLFKDELELLLRRRFREDDIRRLLKLDELREYLVGATVSYRVGPRRE